MTFKCKDGCSFCCSPVPISQEILIKNQGKQVRNAARVMKTSATEYLIYPDDMKCIFLTLEGKCNIYDDRPDICKNFGETKNQPCPFLKMDGAPRTSAKSKQMQKEYNRRIERMRTQNPKALILSNE